MVRIVFLIIICTPLTCCQNNKVERQSVLNNIEVNHTDSTSKSVERNKFKLDNCSILKSIGEFKYEEKYEGFSDVYGFKLTCVNDNFFVDFFGPSPEGEHGIYYFRSDMKRFQLIDSLTFEVFLEKGILYRDSISFENLKNMDKFHNIGFDNTELKLLGKFLSKDSLKVDCVGKNEFDCFGNGKLFIRQ